MITAQDIREKVFETTRLGGYDKAAVNDFLEELADEVAGAQRENATLKSKMKVLVDKIEEYRSNEEALNMALLSAQKLAVQIEAEARQRAAAMLEDAERQVRARVGSIEDETKAAERRLTEAKSATAKFFDAARAMCATQLKNLEAISFDMAPQQPAAPAAPTVDDTVRSIEDTVSRIQPEPAFRLDLGERKETPSTSGLESTQTFNV